MINSLNDFLYNHLPLLKQAVQSSPHELFLEHYYTTTSVLLSSCMWVLISVTALVCLYYFVCCRTKFFSHKVFWLLFWGLSLILSAMVSTSIVEGYHWPDDSTGGFHKSNREYVEKLVTFSQTEEQKEMYLDAYWDCRADADECNIVGLSIPSIWNIWIGTVWFVLLSVCIKKFSKHAKQTP